MPAIPLFRFVSAICWLAVAAAVSIPAVADDAGEKFFTEKIGPVLEKNCYKCHSAKAEEVQGHLLLDTREGIRKGGDNGPAVVPGDADRSFLLKAIKYLEADYQMPPAGKLPDEVIADFVKWVEMGAPDPRGGLPAKGSKVRPAARG